MRKLLTTVLSLSLMVCSLGQVPALGGVQGQPAALLLGTANRIGAFVVSDSGRLYRVKLNMDLNNAVWEDLGGTHLRPSVSIIAGSDTFAFVLGGDGNLYAKYWDGNAWQWSYLGNPGVTLSGNMSAISYRYNGTQNFAIFVVGDDNSLYVYLWQVFPKGGRGWYALGGTALTHYVSAVTSYDKNHNFRIKTYVVGGDGNLYIRYWDGSAWQWQFVGRPDVNVSVALPSATAFPAGTGSVFVVGSNGHLYAWSAVSGWRDGGGSQLSNPPAVLQSFGDGGSASVYIVGGDGTLYGSLYADPNSWYSPGGCNLAPFVSATMVNRYDGKSYHNEPWVIVIGGNRRLYAVKGDVHAQSCGQWYGYDLSSYPNAP
jgi:hypothetical protein